MLHMSVSPAAFGADRADARRAKVLAALALGAALAPTMAVAQSELAPSVGFAPALTAPGSVEVETAPALSASPEAAPVGGAAPSLAAPEASLAPTAAPEGGETRQVEAADEGAETGKSAAAAAPSVVDHGLPHDLSPMGMYAAADVVVKGVMLGLIAASLLTWTVFVVKVFEILGAGGRVRRSIATIRKASSLQEARDAAARQAGPAGFMIREAAEEYGRSYAAVAEAGPSGLKERVGSALSRIEAQAARRMQRGTGLLASIGSVAPFVGLFGTVWGIMNSFIGIAETQTTSLAVVAPGIAEALLATAIGLVAAIPAVIFYNGFARAITGYRQKLIDAAAGVERLVSRDLDFRVEPRGPRR